jgi:hypothetical protein
MGEKSDPEYGGIKKRKAEIHFSAFRLYLAFMAAWWVFRQLGQ